MAADGKQRLADILATRGRATPSHPGGQGAGGRAPATGRGGRARPHGGGGGGGSMQAAIRSQGTGEGLSSSGALPFSRGAVRGATGEAQRFAATARQTPVVLVPGDCRDVLRSGPEAWADCIITDPGVGSLADTDGWQKQVPGPQYWSAILRAAKPGAHMAIFAGRRTFHRVVTYAEDAGWEMRDTVMWVYPKGMPMALDIGQAVDRKMGGDGEPYFRTIGSMTDAEREAWIAARPGNPWYGWGTELRPTWEPIVIMRRPITEGSVADNSLRWGVGAMNIDATRIDSGERDAIATHIPDGQGAAHGLSLQKHQAVVGSTTLGRWPADALFMHDYDCTESGCVEGCPVGILDAQDPDRRQPPSRFFYCPKSSRREKDLGVGPKGNKHKAVKPVAVTDWLTHLLCPPMGVVLDPFSGTCSGGLSAVRLAGAFVGIDHEQGWLDVGRARLLSADSLDA